MLLRDLLAKTLILHNFVSVELKLEKFPYFSTEKQVHFC